MRNKNSLPYIPPPYPFPRMGLQNQHCSSTNCNDEQKSTFGTAPFSIKKFSQDNNFEENKNTNFQRMGNLRKSYNFIKNKIVPNNKSEYIIQG